MKITRDVITDLLPLYQSGDASPDTQALVAEYLAGDPEFAAQIGQINWESEASSLPGKIVQLPKELEMITLNQTKALLKRRSLSLAFAVLFTGLTVAFSWGPDGIRWLWADSVPGAVACVVLAVVFWIVYLNTRGILKDSQL